MEREINEVRKNNGGFKEPECNHLLIQNNLTLELVKLKEEKEILILNKNEKITKLQTDVAKLNRYLVV